MLRLLCIVKLAVLGYVTFPYNLNCKLLISLTMTTYTSRNMIIYNKIYQLIH